MQLPIKIIPRLFTRIGFVIGALITLVMSLVLAGNVLPTVLRAGLVFDGMDGFLIALSIVVFVGSLVGLTVGLINLFGSPLQHLIIDRQGITYRKLLGAQRFSWKDLGPFQAIQAGLLRPRHTQQRYWIVADTLGAIEGGANGFWPLSGSSSLRIPADTYLWPGILVGSMALVTEEAAGWLEQLRQLARSDRLDTEDIPEPPAAFRTPMTIGAPLAPNAGPDSGTALHSFGKRRKPVIER